ncbi:unnamed protein product [Closterium sp. Naga37s-1]|nr:unnamed protein product [Closterium sp. Naga37s-1]
MCCNGDKYPLALDCLVFPHACAPPHAATSVSRCTPAHHHTQGLPPMLNRCAHGKAGRRGGAEEVAGVGREQQGKAGESSEGSAPLGGVRLFSGGTTAASRASRRLRHSQSHQLTSAASPLLQQRRMRAGQGVALQPARGRACGLPTAAQASAASPLLQQRLMRAG